MLQNTNMRFVQVVILTKTIEKVVKILMTTLFKSTSHD